MIQVWDLETWRMAAEFSDLGHTVRSLAFLDGGTRLIAAGDEEILLWSVEAGDLLLTIPVDYEMTLRFPLVAAGLDQLEARWKAAVGAASSSEAGH